MLINKINKLSKKIDQYEHQLQTNAVKLNQSKSVIQSRNKVYIEDGDNSGLSGKIIEDLQLNRHKNSVRNISPKYMSSNLDQYYGSNEKEPSFLP